MSIKTMMIKLVLLVYNTELIWNVYPPRNVYLLSTTNGLKLALLFHIFHKYYTKSKPCFYNINARTNNNTLYISRIEYTRSFEKRVSVYR